jgi:glycosyltransferase involved in cell wall biosynthesis
MKTIFSHPTGNANVRAAALGLNKADILAYFYTSIATFQGDSLDKLGGISPFSDLRKRRFDSSLKSSTRLSPTMELSRMVAAKIGLTKLIEHEKGIFSIDAVYQSLDKKVSKIIRRSKDQDINSIYAYEDSALLSFREAKKLNYHCLFDLPIGYWRYSHKHLKIEQERWPAWASTLVEFNDSKGKLERKDEELSLADKIFVASHFTAKTLLEYPNDSLAEIMVIPYGFPPVSDHRNYSVSVSYRPLKLLFVGGLSQRKGIAYLFEAVNTLGHYVELTVVGHKSSDQCVALDRELSRHKWIPNLSHDEILKLMRENDVFIFPSLFEGFGLVITEAMSQGTPVITTDRTAGPDLIKHGQNGWLVEAGSTEALIDTLEQLIKRPEMVVEAGKAAMETAKKRPWEVYGDELAGAINQSINK